jgi:hypothetical protein
MAKTRRGSKQAKGAKVEREGKQQLPQRIFAQASTRSIGGVSLFAEHVATYIRPETVDNFMSTTEVMHQGARLLADAGFEVLQVTPLTINIAGSVETYQKAFKTTIVGEERPCIKELGVETTAQFLDCPDTAMPGLISTKGTAFESHIEGVALEVPRYFMAPFMFPPQRAYWHLEVPAGVSLGCNADKAHRQGITGQGIRVAMVDSGWYKHPYFVGRGYRAAPVVLGPGAANPLDDESGHGTGESCNIFAVAPDIELLPVKINFVNSIGAFNAAVGLGPHIITCSWGSSIQNGPLGAADNALAAAIATAVARGIIVVFSAGNGQWGFPGQHPDVISAGGTFMKPDESLQASDYASGFMSNIYPNRRVPDLCGLVGMRPKAIYIMLPVQPGDQIDSIPWNDPTGRGLQGGTYPNGDETANNDGWGAFSGTSAAAPQLAGTAALIKQACPRLTPAEVRNIMMTTARDVTTGNCNPSTGGHPAGPGPDLATGNGLVDVHKAVMVAKLRCLGPIRAPRPPIEPPIRPPIEPVRPPIEPVRPPIEPVTPITPVTPPVEPTSPASAMGGESARGGSGFLPQEPGKLSAEDVQAFEDMIIRGELDNLGS